MKRLTLILLLALPLMAADRRRAVDPPEVPPDCSFMAVPHGMKPDEWADATAKANEWAKALGSKFLQCRGDMVRDAFAYLANATLCASSMPPAPGFVVTGCNTRCPAPDVLQYFWNDGLDFPRLGITHTFCVRRPSEFIGRHAYVTTYFLGQPRELEVTDDSCAECEVWLNAPMVHDAEPTWEWYAVPASRSARLAVVAAAMASPVPPASPAPSIDAMVERAELGLVPLTPAQAEQIRIARERLVNLLTVYGGPRE